MFATQKLFNNAYKNTMNNNTQSQYDLVIIGGGVSGAAQYFTVSKYTDIKRVLLVEKESAPGMINSAATNNSQTLHEGDIETNYTLEKARSTKYKSSFTRRYLESHTDLHGTLYLKGPKMVFGVGAKEVTELRKRFQEFKDLFPTLRAMERSELATVEPKMIAGRQEKNVLGLYNEDGLTVNYGALAGQLIFEANERWSQEQSRSGEVRFGEAVSDVVDNGDGYTLKIGDQTVRTRFLSVCAGAHSMYFAKVLNVPAVAQSSLLLIAGNFYYTPKFLNTKVYTLQDPSLPFSAVHADPDILHQADKNRYGPTTRIVMTLERGRFHTVTEYLITIVPVVDSLLAYVRILANGKFLLYAVKHNLIFTIPFLGNYLFMRTARKIVPTMRYRDITLARRQGGVRPQIVKSDQTQPLNMGEAKFTAQNAFFNVTPSPGASTALYNGLVDVRSIAKTLKARFDDQAVKQDFGIPLV